MADPFSIAVGTVGLLDVGWRLVSYLRDVQAGAATVENDLQALQQELEALCLVNESIRDIFTVELQQNPAISTVDPKRLWRNTGRLLQDCRTVVDTLETLLREIIGAEGPKIFRKFDAFRKQLRKQKRAEEFNHLREQLDTLQGALQLLLTSLNLLYTRRSQATTDNAIDHLSEDVQTLRQSLESQISNFQPGQGIVLGEHVHDCLRNATAVASSTFSNQHFHIPQTVSSIFTGRNKLLQHLKNVFISKPLSGLGNIQKRFIIYGLGGSGKTQFACKFAQDNRQYFWGIFWIDGSSDENAKHTFARIAEVGRVEPNERAAKTWLSSLEYPWLLLIDSADDPTLSLDDYFPSGERGYILVTTRNPANQIHSTVGFEHFERLDSAEAESLLLKAAGEPSPWQTPAKQSAALISTALGFLPLALVHAGKAILNRLCTLGEYLDFYDRNWQRIRKARNVSGQLHDDHNMNVYSSYEVIYHRLENATSQEANDAVELLKIFSFLHFESIQIQFLFNAVLFPHLEQEEHEKGQREQQELENSTIGKSWSHTFKHFLIDCVAGHQRRSTVSVVPAVLRPRDGSDDLDDIRLKVALKELTQLSLITHHQVNGRDSYSMHPLVQTWVRQRPQMSNAEQAIWCQAAATMLSQNILLPPLGTRDTDIKLRIDLMPHVDHVIKCRGQIKTRIIENQRSRRRPWPVFVANWALNSSQALQYAKFSLVYSQCGRWHEAAQLQLTVKDYVCPKLGIEHPVAIRIVGALSATYLQLSRTNDAADLQDQILQACIRSLGPTNPKTLKAMDTLGSIRCFQGRFKDALRLGQEAMEGMSRNLGPEHEDTLRAMENVGRAHTRYFRFEEARELSEKAVEGMKKVLGPTHLDTIGALDSLAMTYLELGGRWLRSGREIMEEVLEQRKEKLGREHPYTLLAVCNLGRIRSVMGESKEAEQMMWPALRIAERNLGQNHFGTLAGKAHLARVVVRAGRFAEAESMYMEVIKSELYQAGARDGEHPDRILAMWALLHCYQIQGKVDQALPLLDEMVEALGTLGGQAHPFAKRLSDKRKELLDDTPVSPSQRLFL